MQAQTSLSPETIATLGMAENTSVYPAKDFDKLGIDTSGPEYQNVTPSDFVEHGHD